MIRTGPERNTIGVKTMMNFIKNFRADEDGAVTVDWVVLTAAIVGLGIVAITAVNGGIQSLGQQVAADLTASTASTTDSRYINITGNGNTAPTNP